MPARPAALRPLASLAPAALVVGLVVSVTAACSSTPAVNESGGTTTRVTVARTGRRPNLVVIMTDDQRADEMQYMPKTKKLIGAAGVTFNNSFVSFPLCCPSRASALTGQYAHNHKVLDNHEPAGGNDKLNHADTLPVWFQKAGYATGHVGKYLNQYGEKKAAVVEPGYDDWFAPIDPSTYKYFDYDVLDNGKKRHFGKKPEDYSTDVFAQRAGQDIDTFSAGGKPFYLTVWPVGPHAAASETGVGALSPVPAPRDAGTKAGFKVPRGKAYQEADLSDKPLAIRQLLDRLNQTAEEKNVSIEARTQLVDESERARVESLASVDDLVEQVVGALDRNGQLDNTLIVFTSDNGWLLYEHGFPLGKVLPYEESIRVPLLVRGPGFPKNATANQPVANIDIPATLLEASGVAPGLPQDGASLLGVATDPNTRRDRAVLLESTASGVTPYKGVRVPGWVYVRYDGDGGEELYDLYNDPAQLDNQAANPAFAKAKERLGRAIDALASCAGPSCLVTVPGNELR